MTTPSVPMTQESVSLLIVDDDVELCGLLHTYLGAAGFKAESVRSAEAGVERALSGEFPLVLLDVMLPGMDGFEVLRRIRARSGIPVLMLTACGKDIDRIVGLEIGADDYLPKPFNPRELVARIRAILRRSRGRESRTEAAERLVVGDVEMSLGARQVRCGHRLIDLTGVEFQLLEVLLRAVGRVVPRDELWKSVLGRRFMQFDRSIDMHVSHVRKKLGPTPEGVERIKTVRGVGYIYLVPVIRPESNQKP